MLTAGLRLQVFVSKKVLVTIGGTGAPIGIPLEPLLEHEFEPRKE